MLLTKAIPCQIALDLVAVFHIQTTVRRTSYRHKPMRTLFKENFAGSPLIPRIFGEKIVQLQATIVAEGLDQLTTCDLGPDNSH